MNLPEQHALQTVLAELPTDADDESADMRLRTFLPLPEHARALHERVLVIRGDRGSGKTTLFLVLRAAAERRLDLRELFSDPRIPQARWVEGFSENGARHPMVDVLRELGADKADAALRAFWLGYLAGVLAEDGLLQLPEPFATAWREHRNDPQGWVDLVRLSLGPVSRALDELDASLVRAGERVFVTYDHLDRILLDDPARRRRYTSILVDLWLSLSNRYRALRPKIFLREDLYQATRGEWPDASKVESRSVRLAWREPELFQLMTRHMARDEGLRGWLATSAQVVWKTVEPWGFLPETRFGSEDERRRLMTALSSSHMSAGAKKGYTDRWIIRKSSDAWGAALPRTVLTILRGAAHEELRSPRAVWPKLLHHLSLNRGLQSASDARVQELREEHPDVGRLEALRGRLVPLERAEVEAALGGAEFVGPLVTLGVLIEEDDTSRVDVPDLYRYAFGIGRRGGEQRG